MPFKNQIRLRNKRANQINSYEIAMFYAFYMLEIDLSEHTKEVWL
jgi:hypothetical protein